jgi:tetratricopeptide (TPR) repeat protein
LKITPSFAEARNNIGICLIHLNQLTEASQHFEEAIKSDPNFYDAYLDLGTVLFE